MNIFTDAQMREKFKKEVLEPLGFQPNLNDQGYIDTMYASFLQEEKQLGNIMSNLPSAVDAASQTPTSFTGDGDGDEKAQRTGYNEYSDKITTMEWDPRRDGPPQPITNLPAVHDPFDTGNWADNVMPYNKNANTLDATNRSSDPNLQAEVNAFLEQEQVLDAAGGQNPPGTATVPMPQRRSVSEATVPMPEWPKDDQASAPDQNSGTETVDVSQENLSPLQREIREARMITRGYTEYSPEVQAQIEQDVAARQQLHDALKPNYETVTISGEDADNIRNAVSFAKKMEIGQSEAQGNTHIGFGGVVFDGKNINTNAGEWITKGHNNNGDVGKTAITNSTVAITIPPHANPNHLTEGEIGRRIMNLNANGNTVYVTINPKSKFMPGKVFMIAPGQNPKQVMFEQN